MNWDLVLHEFKSWQHNLKSAKFDKRNIVNNTPAKDLASGFNLRNGII